MPGAGVSPYYKDSGSVPFSSRVSYAARKRMFELFMAVMCPGPEAHVLDIGVTSDTTFKESNYFESLYPYKDHIVCVGTENATHLEQVYPGLHFIPVQPRQPFPFADKQFDIVFSNAVIEHVGNRGSQSDFVREACRVGKSVFITTPNRWFPMETHTGLPILHYLPNEIYRQILRHTRLEYWSHEANLNLLTKNELAGLFPAKLQVRVALTGIRAGPFLSNLVAYCRY